MSSPSWYNHVSRPKLELNFCNKELMIPGPSNLHPKVLQALSRPILAHVDPQFHKILREIQEGLRYVFQTRNDYTFAITGTATCALEMAVTNLLEPGQTLMSLVHGYWGARVADMGERLGLRVHRLTAANTVAPISLQEIEHALQTARPKLFYVCHGDSSLGLVQPLQNIGALCHRYGCLLMVDAVVSLCTTVVSMDAQAIDVIVSGAQKALSGPPGLGLISFSDRAIEVYRARTKPCPSFYMDIDCMAKSYGMNNNNVYAYHYTHAINLIYGLHAALALVVEEGLENIVARHGQMEAYIESKLDQLGLDYLIPDCKNRLPGITSVKIPEDIDGPKVMAYLSQNYNILIGGSLLTASVGLPKFWRLGFLGVNACQDKIDRLIDALKQALLVQRDLRSHL